jgi:hypothetical protein
LPLLGLWGMGNLAEERGYCLLQKGEATSDCTLGTCNPVNFTIFQSQWTQLGGWSGNWHFH